MAAPFGFRLRLAPTLAALVGVVLTLMLGNWQLNRAAEKAHLQQRIERAGRQAPIPVGVTPLDLTDIAYRVVRATGVFHDSRTVYLDNRVHEGAAGYEIISPLRLEGSDRYVLVNRGWLPAGPTRSHLPPVWAPPGQVTVVGVAMPGDPRVFELSSNVRSGRLWQNLTVERYRTAYGLDLQPIFIRAQNDLGDGLIREWRRADVGIERHRAYAFQWFSMCAAIVVLYMVLNARRSRRS